VYREHFVGDEVYRIVKKVENHWFIQYFDSLPLNVSFSRERQTKTKILEFTKAFSHLTK
jgi:hypothetical protein